MMISFNSPLAYGVSICLPEGLLCIEDAIVCNVAIKFFSHKKEGVSFVVDSVSYPFFAGSVGKCNGGYWG